MYICECKQRRLSTSKSRGPRLMGRQVKVVEPQLVCYHNRKCGEQTRLNMIEGDAASSCLQSAAVSSGMTKHAAAFAVQRDTASPSGSSKNAPDGETTVENIHVCVKPTLSLTSSPPSHSSTGTQRNFWASGKKNKKNPGIHATSKPEMIAHLFSFRHTSVRLRQNNNLGKLTIGFCQHKACPPADGYVFPPPPPPMLPKNPLKQEGV